MQRQFNKIASERRFSVSHALQIVYQLHQMLMKSMKIWREAGDAWCCTKCWWSAMKRQLFNRQGRYLRECFHFVIPRSKKNCLGSPQFITILHGVGLESLLQYYSFERKMEGYNPFSALNYVKSHHFILVNVDLWFRVLLRIRKNVANARF